jgi:hypothetical protein
MKVTNQMIINCAKEKGFKIPSKRINARGVTYNITDKDISVIRAKTLEFLGGRDLGEWWISDPGSITQFRVTDTDIKSYIRDNNINNLLNS